MEELGILKLQKGSPLVENGFTIENYIFPSRQVEEGTGRFGDEEYIDFGFYIILESSPIKRVFHFFTDNGGSGDNLYFNGSYIIGCLRPVFTLKPGLIVTEGDGTNEASYKLGVK